MHCIIITNRVKAGDDNPSYIVNTENNWKYDDFLHLCLLRDTWMGQFLHTENEKTVQRNGLPMSPRIFFALYIVLITNFLKLHAKNEHHTQYLQGKANI